MSHLAHINKYKLDLINADIKDPEVQTELVRNAYVIALIRVINKKCIPESDRTDFLTHVLSYWNETFPVEGNLVIVKVKNFFNSLYSHLNTLNGNLYVPLISSDIVTKYPTYNDFQSYADLIECLETEATRKYIG